MESAKSKGRESHMLVIARCPVTGVCRTRGLLVHPKTHREERWPPTERDLPDPITHSVRGKIMSGLNNRNSRQRYFLRAQAQQWFSKCGPRPAVLASLENLSEMQILKPQLKPTEPETSGLCFHWPSMLFGDRLTLRTVDPGESSSWVGKQAIRNGDRMMRQDWVKQWEPKALRCQHANLAG